jgi:S-adenosylmethionine hydrolase
MNELVRDDRTLQGGDNFAEGELPRVARQLVTAVRAADAANDADAAQAAQQLVEIGFGDFLARGDLGALHRALPGAASELDDRMGAIIAAHSESHGKLTNRINIIEIMAIVTLLTDFGLDDTYVGQVKGAILSVAPDATLIDLTHAVPPHDVLAGAFLLWSAVEPFPAGTIHLAVVDPGVGSERRAIALRVARGDVFVGPDNGLLVPALERQGGIRAAVELTEPAYWRAHASSTFHGRDIFGPVAGRLASDLPLEYLGRAVDDVQRPFVLPPPHGLSGEVVHVDTYGNLVTNLPAHVLPEQFHVRIGSHRIPRAAHYAAVEPATLLALVGSTGLLEISARNASAAAITGAGRGTSVTVEPG